MSRLLVGSPPYHQLRTAVILSLLGLVPLLALLLTARRAVGALAHPLSTTGLTACGLLLAAWAILARGSLTSPRRATCTAWHFATWLPGAILLLACLALLPGSSVAGAIAFVSLLIAEEAASWLLLGTDRAARLGWRRPGWLPSGSLVTESHGETSRLSAGRHGDPSSAARLADDLTASLVRRREPDGRETLSGSIRVQFAAGQRTAPVHIAFCPPFFEPPQCEAEQVDGPPASIRVAQVLPYGVRFEVKLEMTSGQATDVWIEFSVIGGIGQTIDSSAPA